MLADIGDAQSLQQNLSTFSGHIRRIKAILASATNRSLVLLDEVWREALIGDEWGRGGLMLMRLDVRWLVLCVVCTSCTAVIDRCDVETW